MMNLKTRSVLVIRLIRLIALCNSLSFAPGFFGSATNIDLKMSGGI